MKKIISIFLTLVLCVGLCAALGVSAYAANEMTDIFEFEEVKNKTSKNGNFELSTTYVSDNGWAGGGGRDNDTLTIYAPNNDLMITRIEAVIGNYGWSYGKVGVSGTAHKEQNDCVDNGRTVTVTNINASEFSFAGGSDWVAFKNITVYYTEDVPTATPEPTPTPAPTPTPTPTPAPVAVKDGFVEKTVTFPLGFTQTQLEDVQIAGFVAYDHYWYLSCVNGETHTFTVSVPESCQLSKVTFTLANLNNLPSVSNGSVTMLKDKMVVSFTQGDNAHSVSLYGTKSPIYNQVVESVTVEYIAPAPDITASTLSEGNIWILCAVGAAAVIAVGAIVIVRKKKNAVADGKED